VPYRRIGSKNSSRLNFGSHPCNCFGPAGRPHSGRFLDPTFTNRAGRAAATTVIASYRQNRIYKQIQYPSSSRIRTLRHRNDNSIFKERPRYIYQPNFPLTTPFHQQLQRLRPLPTRYPSRVKPRERYMAISCGLI